MGLTVKKNDRLEKMLGQFNVKANTSEEEKEKKNKFLAKDKDKDKKSSKK